MKKIIGLVVMAIVLLVFISFVVRPGMEGAQDISKMSYGMEGAKFFGNVARGDLNGDGKEDAGFVITYDGGGSGTFYYAIVALGTEDGYIATNAILLGDRISPQSTWIDSATHELHVAYADRKFNEPMTARPSVGAEKVLAVIVDSRLEISKSNLIVLDTPQPGDLISSPLILKGKARGTWFFEASFPVFLTDWDGKIIAQGIAQAKEPWMTENFVPFEAILEFTKPVSIKGVKNIGSLILKKDNPSGLPEHDNALEITVNFDRI